ncbi:hypothetical protein K4K60_000717 [Colletotrichum sp. SAR11_57]|nr:hypothetical protein K4K60_000717 [Colletotrichum sp. SAR11_57]
MRMSPAIKTEAVTPPTAGRDETDGLTSRLSGLDLDAFPTPPTFGKRQSMGSPTKVKFEKSFDWKNVFNSKKEVKHEINDPQSHASWPTPYPVQYGSQAAQQKPNCPRCRMTFSAEAEVREHLKSQSLCEVLEGVSVEGFDEVQEKQLKSKKRGRVVKSEQDKWREIYRILFPDSSEIPDPLYNLAFDDTTPTGAAQADNQDVETIFKQPVPRKLEEETLSLMEDAVGGQLNTKKRRKIMDVCKDFAIKMLRSPRKGKGSATRSKEHARKATVTATPASPGSSPESSHRLRTSDAPGPMMMLSLDGTMETGSKAAPEAGLSTMDTHWALPQQGEFGLGEEFDFSDWPMWNQVLAEGSNYGWGGGRLSDSSPAPITGREDYPNLHGNGHMDSQGGQADTSQSSCYAGVNLLGSAPEEMSSMRSGTDSTLAGY